MAEDLLPFVEAVSQVFQTMVQVTVEPSEPFLRHEHGDSHDVSGNIGLTGTLSGAMTLCLGRNLACRITETILGEPMDTLNEMVIDSVGEIANVIAGCVRKIMNERGMPSRITLPTVVVGAGHDLGYPPDCPCHVIPFRITNWNENFFLEVCLRP